jgi:lysophospholipase L1-like esterase
MRGGGRVVFFAGVAVAACVVLFVARRSGGPREHDESITDQSIVMLGDSITAEGHWSALLPDQPIVNRGRSGFTTLQLLPVAREVAARKPRAVILLTGTNDIRDAHDAAWTAEHLEAIVNTFRTSAPDTELVLQTILPRADALDAVQQANARIVQLAADHDIRLVDLHRHFDNGAGGLRPNETTDGVHLTAAGYERWATVIERELSPLLASSARGT